MEVRSINMAGYTLGKMLDKMRQFKLFTKDEWRLFHSVIMLNRNEMAHVLGREFTFSETELIVQTCEQFLLKIKNHTLPYLTSDIEDLTNKVEQYRQMLRSKGFYKKVEAQKKKNPPRRRNTYKSQKENESRKMMRDVIKRSMLLKSDGRKPIVFDAEENKAYFKDEAGPRSVEMRRKEIEKDMEEFAMEIVEREKRSMRVLGRLKEQNARDSVLRTIDPLDKPVQIDSDEESLSL